ncbi:MAG TPA: hypothetical protein VGH29_02175, partial [Candidatus Binataceae bacterium]
MACLNFVTSHANFQRRKKKVNAISSDATYGDVPLTARIIRLARPRKHLVTLGCGLTFKRGRWYQQDRDGTQAWSGLLLAHKTHKPAVFAGKERAMRSLRLLWG